VSLIPAIPEVEIERIMIQGQQIPILINKLVIVVHVYNPSNVGGIIGKMEIRGQHPLKKKNVRPYLKIN
jgi:hypothetical protein